MKPINLYSLTRLSNCDLTTFIKTYSIMSKTFEPSIIKEHEKNDLKLFTNLVLGFSDDINLLDNFYYDDKLLQSKLHRNPDYLYDKLLYQGITRVREKLAIIVYNNYSVY